MASPAIELKNIDMTFGADQILHNLHLKIQNEETFVLVGPSGTGKTVLLKIMAGLLPPTHGEVLIRGVNFYSITRDKQSALQRKMGMLFQKNALFSSLTALENISFPLRETTNLTENEIREKAMIFLSEVGLEASAESLPAEMSGGMQKRLGIARALALEPDIIFYDDPTAGLDPITSRKIIEVIMRLQKQNKTTVAMITNDINCAYQMGGQLALLFEDELVLTGTPIETKAHKDPRVNQFVKGELSGPLTEFE